MKIDLFQGDLELEDGTEEDLFDYIEVIIGDEDVEEIYEAFEGVIDTAQNYLTTIQNMCPSCAK